MGGRSCIFLVWGRGPALGVAGTVGGTPTVIGRTADTRTGTETVPRASRSVHSLVCVPRPRTVSQDPRPAPPARSAQTLLLDQGLTSDAPRRLRGPGPTRDLRGPGRLKVPRPSSPEGTIRKPQLTGCCHTQNPGRGPPLSSSPGSLDPVTGIPSFPTGPRVVFRGKSPPSLGTSQPRRVGNDPSPHGSYGRGCRANRGPA